MSFLEREDQHLPLEEAADCNEVTPQLSLLQAEQSKWPQLLLMSLALENFCYLGRLLWRHSNSLMSFLYLCTKTAHSTWDETASVQQGVGKPPSLPGQLCCAWCTPGQDCTFGCQDTLLTHIQLAVNPNPQFSFHGLAFQSLISQFVYITRINLSYVENLSIALVKFHNGWWL